MKETDRIHQNIFYSLVDGLILVSPSLTILHSNLAIEDLFHKSREAIGDRPLEELFPRQPQILDKVRKVLITGACFHDVEAKGARKTSSIKFPVNLTISPYLESDDTIQGVIILIKNNDNEFKYWLDRYKYFDRYPENDKIFYQKKCHMFLKQYDLLLENNRYFF